MSRRSDLLALGLAALVTGAVATTARETKPGRPIPPETAEARFVARSGAPVRQAPNPAAAVIGHLSRGDQVYIDPTETSFPGFTAIVREWLDPSGARFTRTLGWINSSDLTTNAPAIALAAVRTGTLPERIGTIGGHHTLAETRDLMNVVDYRFDEVLDRLKESRERPVDAATLAALEADWLRLTTAWGDARSELSRNLTLKRIAAPIYLGAQYIASEDEWKRALAFVEGQEFTKGSLQDITLRLERILGRKILFEYQPSQDAPDVDIAFYQALDKEIREGEEAAAKVADKAKEIVTSPTGLAIGGSLLALGGLALGIVLLPELLLAARAVRGR